MADYIDLTQFAKKAAIRKAQKNSEYQEEDGDSYAPKAKSLEMGDVTLDPKPDVKMGKLTMEKTPDVRDTNDMEDMSKEGKMPVVDQPRDMSTEDDSMKLIKSLAKKKAKQ